jgi:arsenate reductase
MAKFEIWHNPRCSKSRMALDRLEKAGAEVTVVEYLKTPPAKERIEAVLGLLGFDDPRALMRTSEPVYAELALARVTSKAALVEAMAANPVLIERPVVIRDEQRAVLGRPPERVAELL